MGATCVVFDCVAWAASFGKPGGAKPPPKDLLLGGGEDFGCLSGGMLFTRLLVVLASFLASSSNALAELEISLPNFWAVPFGSFAALPNAFSAAF